MSFASEASFLALYVILPVEKENLTAQVILYLFFTFSPRIQVTCMLLFSGKNWRHYNQSE